MEKSHTCEEGGAHPRISVWHLLMNLKNNYLLKKFLKWADKKYKYFITKIKKNKIKDCTSDIDNYIYQFMIMIMIYSL